jgi:hypothetical protein
VSSNAASQTGGLGLIPGPGQTYIEYGKVSLFCNIASGGTFSSTAIEIIKWVKKIALAQAKISHILTPGKASVKTPKGVILTCLCNRWENASQKKNNYTLFRSRFYDSGSFIASPVLLYRLQNLAQCHVIEKREGKRERERERERKRKKKMYNLVQSHVVSFRCVIA